MTISLVEMPFLVKNYPARLATSLDPKVHYFIGSIHCFINVRWFLEMSNPAQLTDTHLIQTVCFVHGLNPFLHII